jgi:hypothetical protein
MNLGYDDSGYEIYDAEKIKKKRKFVMKPLIFNFRNLSILIIITTVFLLLYDYCSNNFDIDLEEEYKNYRESDLMFGKKNICQYARDKYIYDVLLFKSENSTLSIIAYVILFILFIIILYITGIAENLVRYFIDNLLSAFSLNKILSGLGLYKTLVKLSGCTDELFHTILRFIF